MEEQMGEVHITAEDRRLADNAMHKVFWKKWGPYLSERQWGTVREDYSEDGEAWDYFPHDHARSRVYRWGEDGLAGISDVNQNLCFAIALWNGRDPILKERLFGLTSKEGNHGEDVKELYYYLDNTPTHSYMKYLYKYPQTTFPYQDLTETNRKRSRLDSEYEILNTDAFSENRYFDVFVEYAKAGPEDILIKITVYNRSRDRAAITIIPTLWYRNTWVLGKTKKKPNVSLSRGAAEGIMLECVHEEMGMYYLSCEKGDRVLFTENETNADRLFGIPNVSPFVKDAFHDAVINNDFVSFSDKNNGTKCAILHRFNLAGGEAGIVKLCLRKEKSKQNLFGLEFDDVFKQRITEADEFYAQFTPDKPESDVVSVQRQAFAGLLWNKQYYNYELETWLNGDPGQPAPPETRKKGRNADWKYLFNRDVISMPDKWEYPWYASWDHAFHCVPLSMIDPDFAKKQLVLFTREWYMHPNGQFPAYEWNLSEVNPPVHAWAALKVYEIDKSRSGKGDIAFLKRMFLKLVLNFTWWVNRKDSEGKNIFQGGFLGLDNIGAFDRSRPLPGGGHIEQADGTSWMAMYALGLMDMALEIANEDDAYEDVASKFYEHFVHIAESLNQMGEEGLWDEEDGFYYDALHMPDGSTIPLKVRSLVGLTSLLAVSIVRSDALSKMKGFNKRMVWFKNNREDLGKYTTIEDYQEGHDVLLSLVPKKRLVRILQKMLDENEFLSPGGIRSISKFHRDNPYILRLDSMEYRVDYEPAESKTSLFGGNSNWRGPIWVPINYLFVEALVKYHRYYGGSLQIEYPTGSGNNMTLMEVAIKLSQRMTAVFMRDEKGRRLIHGEEVKYQEDPHFKDLVQFYEYYNGDTCKGLGASHQTGWTALVAEMIQWCWCD
jgi:hypothetical protein